MEKKQIICDTDVMIDFLDPYRARHTSTDEILEHISRDNIILSAITIMELIEGAGNKEHLLNIRKRLRDYSVAFMNHEITESAIDLLLQYHLSHGLELADSIIAATCLYSDLELFTYNTKDYKFIEGLKLYKYNANLK